MTYGRTQAEPGKIPKTLTYESCQFKLIAKDPEGTVRETINMSYFIDRLESIYGDCVRSGLAYTGGFVYVGVDQKFFAYFGGVARVALDGRNGTVGS